MSRKKNSGYFHWNDRLDQLLVKSMRTLVDEKKIDPKGKFIAGAYLVLEQMLENDSPGCGVKADPNIVSRVKTLKAKFLAMQELRGLSGAGWDDEQKMVELEDSTYDEYVASHPHCAKMNRVPFPCYDGLAYVFGKTDPTGQPNNTPEGREVPSPSVNAGNSEGSNRRKRARPSNIGTCNDVNELKPIFEDAASSLRSMVQESDNARKQRGMILPELEMIEGLTVDQVYDAAIRLGKDDSMLELFFNITTNQGRKRFIERLLL
ncbi:hypothetical protein LINPERHAP2_LOCUS7513 [Linum perenne]